MQKRTLMLAALINALALPLAAAEGFDMEEFLWRNRPLLLFVPHSGFSPAQALERDLARAGADLTERDMRLIRVEGSERAILEADDLPPATAALLRQRYRVPDGTVMLILVGKDGGEKLRGDETTDLQAVFERVDSMPMRRREMREGGVSRTGSD